jgi:23S rRNA (pseudouridine1915-N3)-methyltransferase
MKIKLLQIGKTTESYLLEGIALYEKRLQAFTSFSCETVASLKDASSLSILQVKQREGELILAKIKPDDFLVLLDENGRTFDSVEFARQIEQLQVQSTRQLVFVVGGAFGFSEEVYRRARMKIALSEMTFSHQLVRLIFMEQLYRAFTIINKHPYHHI